MTVTLVHKVNQIKLFQKYLPKEAARVIFVLVSITQMTTTRAVITDDESGRLERCGG